MSEVKLKVDILEHTPNPELNIANAIKLCYSPLPINEIREDLEDNPKQVEKLLNIILENGHYSTLEHSKFTFSIEGVSIVLLKQLTRHRTFSYSVKSGRFVDEKNMIDFVIPAKILSNPKLKKRYIEKIEKDYQLYVEFRDELIKDGYTVKEAIEDARYLLPQAKETKLVMTADVRNLYNFFKLRCCNCSQYEIRQLANEMLRQCKEIAPTLFSKAGKDCDVSECQEKTMSCKER